VRGLKEGGAVVGGAVMIGSLFLGDGTEPSVGNR
jgi:hypothetical protein